MTKDSTAIITSWEHKITMVTSDTKIELFGWLSCSLGSWRMTLVHWLHCFVGFEMDNKVSFSEKLVVSDDDCEIFELKTTLSKVNFADAIWIRKLVLKVNGQSWSIIVILNRCHMKHET